MKHELPEGAKAKFAHGRRVAGDWGLWYRKPVDWGRWDPEGTTDGKRTHTSDELSPHGGHTSCVITLADKSTVTGSAECSLRDNYSKKLGRDISLGRALAALERRTA